MKDGFRTRLRDRQTLIGTIVSSTDPATAEVLTECGFDWLFIDAEHGPHETTDLLPVLRAVDHRIPCIVRVPASEEIPIKKTLDIGVTGIIAPQTVVRRHGRTEVQMEYAPGGNLGEYARRKNGLSEGEARRLFRQIVEAVGYLHAKDICHRDIKPENIVLDSQRNAKLVDFGAAREGAARAG